MLSFLESQTICTNNIRCAFCKGHTQQESRVERHTKRTNKQKKQLDCNDSPKYIFSKFSAFTFFTFSLQIILLFTHSASCSRLCPFPPSLPLGEWMTRSLSVSLIRALQQQQLPGKTGHPQGNNTSIDPLLGRLALILARIANSEAGSYCHGNRSAWCGRVGLGYLDW